MGVRGALPYQCVPIIPLWCRYIGSYLGVISTIVDIDRIEQTSVVSQPTYRRTPFARA
ncbi:hypothetical protein AArcSl_0214 [Halalkaliarchaeum desulfuricum]|uniref:Uncharacterized protein n=1 Tax=Halalkaliarchaeum desulfuricum TaxID=2055893 RepID=A0A343TFJ7_9EURY|nr:hypothetical protein AArcSl_0214 [Halalkaliarchaeum desulfuricum]